MARSSVIQSVDLYINPNFYPIFQMRTRNIGCRYNSSNVTNRLTWPEFEPSLRLITQHIVTAVSLSFLYLWTMLFQITPEKLTMTGYLKRTNGAFRRVSAPVLLPLGTVFGSLNSTTPDTASLFWSNNGNTFATEEQRFLSHGWHNICIHVSESWSAG